MFSFFHAKGRTKPDFSCVAVDMHSHLIPGVDDGAQSAAESFQMIIGLQELGFSHLFTTPHSMKDMYPNSLATLENGFTKIKKDIPAGISMDYSSEYYLDELFTENLASGAVRPLPGNRLLVEFSIISKAANTAPVLFDLRLKGYQPVLAHPERYLFLHKHPKSYTRLKDMGLEFQVNALSLVGFYGTTVRNMAENLIAEGYIDFIGTDIHKPKQLLLLRKVPATRSFQDLLKNHKLLNQSMAEQG